MEISDKKEGAIEIDDSILECAQFIMSNCERSPDSMPTLDEVVQFIIHEQEPKIVDLDQTDPMFDDVARFIVQNQLGSTSAVQRRFSIGYNRAGRIMDQIEAAGIVGRAEGERPREVLVQDMNSLEMLLANFIDSDPPASTLRKFPEKWLYLKYEWEHQKFIEEAQMREREMIANKIKERHRIKQLEKIIRQELIDSGELFGEQPKRPPIAKELVDAVYIRDGGRCVYCGSVQNLHIDHIIPFSKGGATCIENLQLLCQKCNLEKSNKIG